jgi:hypothetical protein
MGGAVRRYKKGAAIVLGAVIVLSGVGVIAFVMGRGRPHEPATRGWKSFNSQEVGKTFAYYHQLASGYHWRAKLAVCTPNLAERTAFCRITLRANGYLPKSAVGPGTSNVLTLEEVWEVTQVCAPAPCRFEQATEVSHSP